MYAHRAKQTSVSNAKWQLLLPRQLLRKRWPLQIPKMQFLRLIQGYRRLQINSASQNCQVYPLSILLFERRSPIWTSTQQHQTKLSIRQFDKTTRWHRSAGFSDQTLRQFLIIVLSTLINVVIYQYMFIKCVKLKLNEHSYPK